MAVLGVIKGFSGLDITWQDAVKAMGDSIFINTDYSFNKAVDKTLEYAKKLAVENGGESTAEELKIKIQQPQPFALEVAFPKLVFDKKVSVFANEGWETKGKWETFGNNKSKFSSAAGDEISFTFEGTGVSIAGNWFKDGGKADVYVDGELKRTIDCYFYFSKQQHDDMSIYHIINLPEGKHTIKLVVKGEKRPESEGAKVYVNEAIVFKTGDKISDNYKFSFQK
jgi:hypothetical protein